MSEIRPTSCTTCTSSSSASAWSAPAIGALGAKSPPMASNAMRANVMLPLLLLAVHRRNIRTLHKRGAGASCSGSADISGSRLRARSCAYSARASFSLRYVAWGRPFDIVKKVGVSSRKGRRESRAAFPSGCRSTPARSRTIRCSSLFHTSGKALCNPRGTAQTSVQREATPPALPASCRAHVHEGRTEKRQDRPTRPHLPRRR